MGLIERIDWAPDWREQIGDLAEEPLDRAAAVVSAVMHREMPASTDGSHGRQPGYARSKIYRSKGRDAGGRYREVGTSATTPDGTSYPAILEHGSKAHVIESKGPYPLRDSKGRVVGRPVLDGDGRLIAWRVHHPGTKPIPWARASALALAGRVFR